MFFGAPRGFQASNGRKLRASPRLLGAGPYDRAEACFSAPSGQSPFFEKMPNPKSPLAIR